MVDIKVKTRETGATSVLGAKGRASIKTVTGGELEVVTGVSEPGFNPLDLLYSSLAACLVLSVKGRSSSFSCWIGLPVSRRW